MKRAIKKFFKFLLIVLIFLEVVMAGALWDRKVQCERKAQGAAYYQTILTGCRVWQDGQWQEMK